MSKLSELIAQLCPDGVEYKTICQVVKSISTGLNPRQNFRLNIDGATNYYVTVKEITTGKIVFSSKTDRITNEAVSIIQERSHLEKGDVLLSGIGTIGKVALVDIDTSNWNCSESVILLKPLSDIISPKFLKYILETAEIQDYFRGNARGATLKGIRQQDLNNLPIPVPPLPVQSEIVRMLDSFTELTTELTTELAAELTARKQQYEYYREELLETSLNAVCMSFGDIFEFQNGFAFKSNLFKNSGKPILRITNIQGSQIDKNNLVYFEDGDYKEDLSRYIVRPGDIVIAMSGATTGKIGVNTAQVDYYLNQRVGKFVPKENVVLNRYLYHLLLQKASEIYAISEGGAQPNLSSEKLKRITSLIPPITEQERIADILDRFDALCNDITAGLPAEIEARKKQYEYYRDKLLTFTPAV